MANITKVDPFTDLFRFEPFRDADELFPSRLRRLFRDLPAEPTIRLDVSEDEKAYHVKAELPGVRKEDIQLNVRDRRLELTGRRQPLGENRNFLRMERSYGPIRRAFDLSAPLDTDNIAADFEAGILRIHVPKRAGGPGATTVPVREE